LELAEARDEMRRKYSASTQKEEKLQNYIWAKVKEIMFLTFKIFFEVILFLILLLTIETLIWWSLVWMGKTFGKCELFDPGLFKAPVVKCQGDTALTQFLKATLENYFSRVGMPFIFIFLVLLAMPFNLHGSFSITVAFSLITASVLVLLVGNKVYSSRFPVLSRTVLQLLIRSVTGLKNSLRRTKF
jgi:hypothetical protein